MMQVCIAAVISVAILLISGDVAAAIVDPKTELAELVVGDWPLREA